MTAKMKSRSPAVLRRGRAFEQREKSGWTKLDEGEAQFEATTEWRGRRGRIDIRIPFEGWSTHVELKATDWERMKPHRVRPNLRRHLRQVFRYVDAEVAAGRDVCPGIIYARAPCATARRREVETFFRENGVQLVWRQE